MEECFIGELKDVGWMDFGETANISDLPQWSSPALNRLFFCFKRLNLEYSNKFSLGVQDSFESGFDLMLTVSKKRLTPSEE
jgi:hypothetical protein